MQNKLEEFLCTPNLNTNITLLIYIEGEKIFWTSLRQKDKSL